jgi:hypothetical protein
MRRGYCFDAHTCRRHVLSTRPDLLPPDSDFGKRYDLVSLAAEFSILTSCTNTSKLVKAQILGYPQASFLFRGSPGIKKRQDGAPLQVNCVGVPRLEKVLYLSRLCHPPSWETLNVPLGG